MEKTIIVPFVSEDPDLKDLVQPSVCQKDFLTGFAPEEIDFARVAFNHPLFIMFSSGTTGAPKCIVHGHGGTLLQHKKEPRVDN